MLSLGGKKKNYSRLVDILPRMLTMELSYTTQSKLSLVREQHGSQNAISYRLRAGGAIARLRSVSASTARMRELPVSAKCRLLLAMFKALFEIAKGYYQMRHVCLWVRPHGITWLELDIFALNMTFEFFLNGPGNSKFL